MISFEPRISKAQTGQTSGGFAVIIIIIIIIIMMLLLDLFMYIYFLYKIEILL